MISITPTKIADYLNCPLKFKLRHMDKSGAPSSSPALAFGNCMHQTLQAIHNGKNLPETASEATQLLKRFWDKSAYENPEEEAIYFAKGCYSLENYCKAAAASPEKTLGTEVFMSLIIDFKGLKIRLGCKVDRLALHENDVIEVIDYKTNRNGKISTLEFLREDLSTFLYFLLTRLTYPQYPNIKVTFLNVLTLARVTVDYEKSLIEKNKQALWNCLKTIAAEKFLPRTSESCAWCDFQNDCPAQNRVMDYREIKDL